MSNDKAELIRNNIRFQKHRWFYILFCIHSGIVIGRDHKRPKKYLEENDNGQIFHNSISNFDFLNPNVCDSNTRCESCAWLSNLIADEHLTIDDIATVLGVFKGGSK